MGYQNEPEAKKWRVQKFYDGESSHYLADRYVGESCEHLSYRFRQGIVLEFLGDASGRVLDLGCGPAVYTKVLSERGFRVFSADLSFEMLVRARSLAPTPFDGSWINCEIDLLPIQGGVADAVLAIGVLAYSETPAGSLQEIARCMKPGATLVIQCSNLLCPTAAIDALKDRILIAARLRERPYDFALVRYRLGALLTELERAGLQPLAFKRYDFRLPFLERIAPSMARKIMTMLQRAWASSGLFGWTAEGFVIKAQRR